MRNYIKNQEIHHRLKSWEEETDEFIRKYGFNRFPAKARDLLRLLRLSKKSIN